jgi:multidrug transporter EmrE-like cation transporter
MDYLIHKAWIYVFFAGLNSTIGNLLLKKSSDISVGITWNLVPLNIWFISGLMFYGLNVLLFAKALKTLEVAAAYPVLAGISFCLLPVASFILFNERLSPTRYVGIVVVLLGIYLLTKEQ